MTYEAIFEAINALLIGLMERAKDPVDVLKAAIVHAENGKRAFLQAAASAEPCNDPNCPGCRPATIERSKLN